MKYGPLGGTTLIILFFFLVPPRVHFSTQMPVQLLTRTVVPFHGWRLHTEAGLFPSPSDVLGLPSLALVLSTGFES